MQTEQQKILWIVFSVALFILVVVGVGVIWFLPPKQAAGTQVATTQAKSQAKISFDPYEWAQSQANKYPGLETPPAGQAPSSQSSQGTSNFTIIYGQQPEQPAPPAVVQQPQARTPAQPAPPPVSRPQAYTPPPPRVAPAPQPRAQVSAAPETRPIVQHWIQVAAFESAFRAEQARKLLDQNGLAGKIISGTVRGKTFFRVRIGPYSSQSEAARFLTQVKRISEFRNSYTFLTYGASAN